MTNEDIKTLFESKLESYKGHNHYSFMNWSRTEICSDQEMNLFKNWLNQISEEEVCKYLSIDSTILSVILNQNDSICKSAINRDPWSIKFVKDQKKHLCELAMGLNPFVMTEIQNQSVDLCILALEEFPICFRDVKIVSNPDFETTLRNLKEKKAILDAINR